MRQDAVPSWPEDRRIRPHDLMIVEAFDCSRRPPGGIAAFRSGEPA
jgi:hypothetical protein